MTKSPDAFRTISEVADWLGVQAHVLRFWESKFTQVKPVKRAGGRRYYRPADMLLIGGIKHLLHTEGMTIKGVQKFLREQGIAHVSSFSQSLEDSAATDVDSNVVPFETRAIEPEDIAPAEPEQSATDPTLPDTPAPEPVAESPAPDEVAASRPDAPAEPTAPEPAEASGLPAFLTEPLAPIQDKVEAAAPKPDVVDAPDPPPEDQIAVTEGALTKLTRLRRIDPETARAITPYAARLAVLRDTLAAVRKE